MTDLSALIDLVLSSKLLRDDERSEWISKMEIMTEQQLATLESILTRGEGIEWNEELPKYEAAVTEAEELVENATPDSLLAS